MVISARSGRVRAQRASRRVRNVFGITEQLEQRTLLSAQWPGVVVGVTPGSSAASPTSTALRLIDEDGGATMIRDLSPIYPIGHKPVTGPVASVAAAAPRATAASGLDIVLLKGPNLLANASASAAFDAAAAFFESIFHDPITVTIDAEIAPLGTNVLGQAMSVVMGDTFDRVRDLLVADANPVDEAFVSQLPTESNFYSTLPDGSYTISGSSANRANLLALGVPASELDYGPDSDFDPSQKIDASIIFSSNYPFDYNRADGIGAGKSDFIGVATHEIAHALGFVSAIDRVDYMMSNGGDGLVGPTPLDMFRFEPGAGGLDFTGGWRVLSPGDVVRNQVFYDGGLFDPSLITQIPGLSLGDIPFSTGSEHGDTWQAGHWKDDQYIGGFNHVIGLMDPLSTTGRVVQWSAADNRALSLIGWDTTPAAPVTSISGTVYEDLDGNGAMDGSDTGLGGWTVYQDTNDNGSADAGEASVVTGSSGAYRFSGIGAGTYTVREVLQAGYNRTAPATPGGAHSVTVAEGDAAAEMDFGNQQVAGASISGTLYEDVDADGRRDAGEIGMGGWTIYQDVDNDGRYDDGTAVRTNDTIIDIPDPPPAAVATSPIVVTDLPGVVTDLNINLTITHPWTNDLTAYLISPRGTRVLLFTNLGNLFAHEDFEGTTLDDEAGNRIQDETPPFTGSYRPMQPLSAVDDEPMNGTWRLEVRDSVDQDEGWINEWSLVFTVGEPEAWVNTDPNGDYEFTDLAPGTYHIRQIPDPQWTQTEPANNGAHTVVVTEGQQVRNVNFGDTQGAPRSSVVGRHVFYNNSKLDGYNAEADSADDAAIATGTQALLPGQGPATSANYTGYYRGINGVMIDVANLPSSSALSASDFTFLAGNNDDPSSWSGPSQEPTSVTVRRGAGDNGSDRVTITWADNVIRNQWLQVAMQPGDNTGLAAADVFYFGNLAGETGNSSNVAAVNGLDVLAVRRALAQRGQSPDAAFDFNGDGRVNALDLGVARANQGNSLTLFSAPAAAAAGASFSEVPIAAAATTLRASRVWDETPASLLA